MVAGTFQTKIVKSTTDKSRARAAVRSIKAPSSSIWGVEFAFVCRVGRIETRGPSERLDGFTRDPRILFVRDSLMSRVNEDSSSFAGSAPRHRFPAHCEKSDMVEWGDMDSSLLDLLDSGCHQVDCFRLSEPLFPFGDGHFNFSPFPASHLADD